MAYTLPNGLRDREYDKFIAAGSGAIAVVLYAASGATFIPVKCLNDGTIVTSGA